MELLSARIDFNVHCRKPLKMTATNFIIN